MTRVSRRFMLFSITLKSLSFLRLSAVCAKIVYSATYCGCVRSCPRALDSGYERAPCCACMRLAEYVKSRPRGEIARLARVSGVTTSVLSELVGGHRLLSRYSVAKRVSNATGGVVTVAELCEAPNGNGGHGPDPAQLEAAARRLSAELGCEVTISCAPPVQPKEVTS